MSDVAKEYGAALFMLASEEGSLEACAAGLQTVNAVLSDQPEYLALLASPAIPLSERLDNLRAAFAQAVPQAVLSFLQLLCENGRTDCLSVAGEEFFALLDAHNRVTQATVTSAAELTEQQKTRLRQALEKKGGGRVEMHYTVDPTLLGGLTVHWDGKVLDGSLRQRLRDIKDVINT